jgi:hypothetical protein
VLALLVACGGHYAYAPVVSIGSGAGDHVVYRFSGKLLDVSVTLREEVVSRAAGRATIDVRATRGREERHWLQIGPDSADARWNNTVDEIDVMRDGAMQRLANPEGATLARLYEWVVVAADEKSTAHDSGPCERSVGNTTLACTCDRATRTFEGKEVRTEESRCPGFAWQRGPARWSTPDGDVLWQVEVIEASATGSGR